jgi:phage terminase large subunit-like protein
MNLEPYQRDALIEALTPDENGRYKYSIIVWSDIKKSAKSTIAAAVTLYRASFTEFGEFYVVANDLKQADSRVNHYLRRAIMLNPKMRERYKQQGYKITTPSGAFVEAIPIDPSGEAGTNADMVVFSELWGANEDAKQKMWSEMTIPPAKHGHAFRWIESYAGFTEESELLYSLYELGVKQGELLWPERLYNVTEGDPSPLELYVNRSAGMLCLWNTQPRCPWHTKSYYSGESKILPPNQFSRIHRNQWVSSTETFIPMEWWDACFRKSEEWPAIDISHQAMVLAADAATSNDNFGLWMGCRHPQLPGEILTVYVQKWVPGANGKIDFQGTEEKPGPELMIRKLIEKYNIVQLCYDPYQLYDLMNRLKKEGLRTWFKEFNQGTDRLIADSQLRDLIRDRHFWHRGETDLREHMQNANAKLDEQDSKVRIVKRVEKLKIDLAVAASMGSHILMKLNL